MVAGIVECTILMCVVTCYMFTTSLHCVFISHDHMIVTDISLGIYKPSALLFGLLKPRLGSH